jgi:Transposase
VATQASASKEALQGWRDCREASAGWCSDVAGAEHGGCDPRQIGVSEMTYYRWRQEFGGLKIEQVKRLKELELENSRLRKAVCEGVRSELSFWKAGELQFGIAQFLRYIRIDNKTVLIGRELAASRFLLARLFGQEVLRQLRRSLSTLRRLRCWILALY